jgi:hypothetical protein
MQDAEYLDVFMHHLKHWQMFEVYLYQAHTVLNTLNKVKGRVPLLEELSLQIYDYDWLIHEFNVFEFAPALTNPHMIGHLPHNIWTSPWCI